MRILFAHPADVAEADQAAAARPGTCVRLRRLVPLGRMYVLSENDADRVRFGFDLEQFAGEVVIVGVSHAAAPDEAE